LAQQKENIEMSVPAAFMGVILIWSTTPLAIKWSGEEVGFIFGVSLRMAIGTLLCLLVLLLLRKPLPWDRAARHSYIAAAFGIYASMSLVYWGATYVPSGLISVLFGINPLLTAVLAFFALGERHLSLVKLVGIGLGVSGLAVIFHDSLLQTEQLRGILLILAAVIVHVISAIWVKRTHAQLSSISLTTGALLHALPAYLLTWWLVDGTLPAVIPERSLFSILYLGIFGSVVGFMMYFYILKHVQATHVALLTLITPVLALLLGQYLNHESITMWVAAGTALILFGMTLFQWGHLLRVRNKAGIE
jgi:drug/metabolite transporter (DMT)-like permease